jgi:hypothetical protein
MKKIKALPTKITTRSKRVVIASALLVQQFDIADFQLKHFGTFLDSMFNPIY